MEYEDKEKQRAYDKKRYYANLEANRERVKLYMRDKRKKEPEKIRKTVRECWHRNKHKYNPRQNKRYYENREERIEKQQEYYKKHREERLAYNKKYIQTTEGQQRRKVASARRRAWKNNVIETYTQKQWKEKLEATNGICPGCGENVGIENLQLDHIYPISKAEEGRIYTIDDIQPLCGRCNNKKNNRILKE